MHARLMVIGMKTMVITSATFNVGFFRMKEKKKKKKKKKKKHEQWMVWSFSVSMSSNAI